MTSAPALTLALISHTNVGKTTLARTLLGQDVGEVRDRAHVTLAATEYTMLALPDGAALNLWDTPGFGDSVRLARRLEQEGNPIGWFLMQVWDRFRDRPFWLAQQAVRTVRDDADVVLYLVNASEDPSQTAYLAPELQVMQWVGKPVIVLLNQMGAPRSPDEEASEVARWRAALASQPLVSDLLPLDAFARCWVQEITLLRAVVAAVREGERALATRLADAWQERRWAQFRASMRALASPIAAAAREQIALPEARTVDALRGLARKLGIGRQTDDARIRVVQDSALRIAAGLRASTDEVIRIHGLSGNAREQVLAYVESDVAIDEPVSEAKAAMVGGVVSGALSGLAADLAVGGLSLGAGLLTGSVLGALGGASVARGYNVVRGNTESTCQWNDAFLDGLVRSALLRYLAVAHYGRGRGEWSESEQPAFWRERVARVVERRRHDLHDTWSQRTDDAATFENAVVAQLEAAGRDTLNELYPGVLADVTRRDPEAPSESGRGR